MSRTDGSPAGVLRGRSVAGSRTAGVTTAGGDLGPLLEFMEGLRALLEKTDWMRRGLCAQTDPESFFPDKGDASSPAKRVCRGCEVRPECLQYALGNDERFGIWGGMTQTELRRFRREAAA